MFCDIIKILVILSLKVLIFLSTFPNINQLPKNPSPISEVWISDDIVAKVTINIAYHLSDRRSTDVTDVERFSYIGTYVVDDDGWVVEWWDGWIIKIWEYIYPNTIMKKKVHISSCGTTLTEYLCVFSEFCCDFFRNRLGCLFQFPCKREYIDTVFSELRLWRYRNLWNKLFSKERMDGRR